MEIAPDLNQWHKSSCVLVSCSIPFIHWKQKFCVNNETPAAVMCLLINILRYFVWVTWYKQQGCVLYQISTLVVCLHAFFVAISVTFYSSHGHKCSFTKKWRTCRESRQRVLPEIRHVSHLKNKNLLESRQFNNHMVFPRVCCVGRKQNGMPCNFIDFYSFLMLSM